MYKHIKKKNIWTHLNTKVKHRWNMLTHRGETSLRRPVLGQRRGLAQRRGDATGTGNHWEIIGRCSEVLHIGALLKQWLKHCRSRSLTLQGIPAYPSNPEVFMERWYFFCCLFSGKVETPESINPNPISQGVLRQETLLADLPRPVVGFGSLVEIERF